MDSIVAVSRGLVHRYRSIVALQDIDLEIRSGITGLVGVNGAGKSTLLNISAGALAPTSGSFSLDSAAASSGMDSQVDVALMPQRFDPSPRLRVDDFLRYCAWLRALPKKAWDSETSRVLQRVQLTDRATQRLGELSGGMLRRVNLAQALLGSPRLLLLDEPTEGLDPEQRASVRQLIKEIPSESATVVSSHDMDDIGMIADRVVMLEAGAVRFEGTVTEMRQIGERSGRSVEGVSVLEAAFLELRKSVAA